MKQNQESVFE